MRHTRCRCGIYLRGEVDGFGGAWSDSVLADELTHEKRDDGDGAHCELQGGSEEGVEGRRENAAIQSVDGGEIGQSGVGQALRDEEHCHGDAGPEVGYQAFGPSAIIRTDGVAQ